MLSVSPFLVIDDNTNFEVIKKFKSTLYTRHKVDLELNFSRTYPFFLKFLEYGMDKFHLSSISRENSPWYVHINLNEDQVHIFKN